jgi:hypothetical protein
MRYLLQVAAAAAAADAEAAEGDDEARASVAAAAVKESYDYLLSMAIYSLTWEKVQVGGGVCGWGGVLLVRLAACPLQIKLACTCEKVQMGWERLRRS